jgi:hypothetical protein
MCCHSQGSNPNPLNFYDLLGVAYYITNCVVGLLISTVCFFLVEAPLVRTAPFGALFYVNTIILPRQARDKHRKS